MASWSYMLNVSSSTTNKTTALEEERRIMKLSRRDNWVHTQEWGSEQLSEQPTDCRHKSGPTTTLHGSSGVKGRAYHHHKNGGLPLVASLFTPPSLSCPRHYCSRVIYPHKKGERTKRQRETVVSSLVLHSFFFSFVFCVSVCISLSWKPEYCARQFSAIVWWKLSWYSTTRLVWNSSNVIKWVGRTEGWFGKGSEAGAERAT